MERREFYKGKMQPSRRDSGLHLLDRLLEARAHADLTHSSNTAVIDAKIRLENLRFETLASSHPSAFTDVRDELANLMLDLPEPCLLYTSPSPRDGLLSRMPSSA